MPVRYRLLGPLDVVGGADDGVPVELGSPKQRAVLAVLLLNRGRVVSADRLIDAVWGDEAPPSALASLQAYVSNLRRALREGSGATSPILRQAPGYRLDVPAGQLDVTAFRAAAEAARLSAEAGRWDQAMAGADAALALWRGPVLADLRDEPWVRVEAAGLDELRAECQETRVTALLAVGRISPALVEAQQLRAEHPLRERTAWLHLIALHRAGRSAEALAEFRGHARRLDEELGLEPGAELRDLQGAILRQDPALAAWPLPPQWAGASPAQAPAAEPDQPPATDPEPAPEAGRLVGRARELAVIDSIMDDVGAGSSRWLVFTGPAGIGKSRLAEAASARLRAAGGREVWARCPEEEGAPAWWPLRQLVRGLDADPDAVLVPPAGADPDAARFAVYERLLALLEAAAGTPLAIVVDDVQWADPTSLRCLAYLAGALRGYPVGVILTLRDAEAGAGAGALLSAVARTEGNRQLSLPALAVAEVGLLASQVAGEWFGPAQAQLLAERTGGNPLFVSEYARLPAAERLGDGLPLAVRSVLGRRLAGLDPAALQVLRVAAVMGDVLDVEVLAAATRLDLDTLADHLDQAADERIIVAAPGTGGYAFAHGLLREEVLAAMPAVRRQRLHARVAAALAGAGALPGGALTGDALTRRAQHLVAALPLADPAEVLAACRAAAQEATDRWSSESAARWWEAALQAFDLLPAGARATRDRDDLLVARVEALARAGRGQTVLDVVEAGLLDAVREGRTSAAGRLAAALLRTAGAWPWPVYGAAPGPVLERLAGLEPFVAADPAAHARVLAAFAVGSCYDPDPAVPDGLSRRAIELAESLGDPDVIADALLGRASTFIAIAEYAREAVELLERLARLDHRQTRPDQVLAHAMLTMTRMNLGEVEAAAEHVRAAIAGSEVLRLPTIRVQMRWMEGQLAQWRGDFDEAAREFATAGRIHRQTELYTFGTGIAEQTLRWQQGTLDGLVLANPVEPEVWAAAIAATRGEAAQAAELIAAWLARPGPPVWTTLGHRVIVAHLVADLELVQHARGLIELLSPMADRIANIGQVGVVGSVATALARLHLLLGEPDRARELLTSAQRLAARTGGRPTLLSCRLQLARLQPPGPGRQQALAAVGAEAHQLGMRAIETAATRALAERA